jgi:hypothetical protein
MSVDFDPVRLRPPRRRLDPIVFGVVAIVIGLGAAVVKPWEAGAVGRTSAAASTAPATSAAAAASVAATQEPATRLASIHTPIWADLAPIVVPHDAWGIRAIFDGARGGPAPPSSDTYAANWSPATRGRDGGDTAIVQREERPIVVLGVTAPLAAGAVDARIWRVHTGGQLEWLDVVPILSGDVNGSFLYLRPGTGGAPFTAWDAGTYRIDVLAGDAVERIQVRIPGATGVVPPLQDLPPSPAVTVRAADSFISGVGPGPFATADGMGLQLEALPYRPLTEAEAWQDLALFDGAHVASAALPRASGLGVMLRPGALLVSARIDRLSPGATSFASPAPTEDATEHPPRSRYAVFAPEDGGAWRPGLYAISVAWTDETGAHQGTWHIELRPDGG